MPKVKNLKNRLPLIVLLVTILSITAILLLFFNNFPNRSYHIEDWDKTASILNGLISPILLLCSVILIWMTWQTNNTVINLQELQLMDTRLESKLVRFGRRTKQLQKQIEDMDLLPEKAQVRSLTMDHISDDLLFNEFSIKKNELNRHLLDIKTPILKCIEVYNRLYRDIGDKINAVDLLKGRISFNEYACILIGEELNNSIHSKKEFIEFKSLIKKIEEMTINGKLVNRDMRDEFFAEFALNFDRALAKELLKYDHTLDQVFKSELIKYL